MAKIQGWQVLYGGSFNPLHIGHVAMVNQLVAWPMLAKVWAVPAHTSPYKQPASMLPHTLRLNMLQAQFAGMPKVRVCPVEIHTQGPSYTVDTLHWLRDKIQPQPAPASQFISNHVRIPASHPLSTPPPNLALVLGWDAFMGMAGWRKIDTILRMAALWVVPRLGKPRLANAPAGWLAQAPLPLQQLLLHTKPPALVKALLAGQPPPSALCQELQLLPFVLPAVSSSSIRHSQSTCLVAPKARPLLQAYWQTGTLKPPHTQCLTAG